MDVVLKLREIRRLRNLSQKDVALRSGVGEKTLSSFETGQRTDSMKLTQFLAILRVYGMTPAEFFGGAVEAAVFADAEQLTESELHLIRQLRCLPEEVGRRLEESFLTMIAGVDAIAGPRLRAVRSA